MRPPDKERGPGDHGPDLESTTIPIAYQSNRHHGTRPAEDCVDHLLEVDHWLDSLDVVLLDAMGGGSWSKAEVCEYVLVGHGKVRRHLGAALVREAVA